LYARNFLIRQRISEGTVKLGFGIETLTGLIEIYKPDPDLLKRSEDPE